MGEKVVPIDATVNTRVWQPRAVVREVLFHDIHAARRSFWAGVNKEPVEVVKISEPMTQTARLARIEALQTVMTGKVPERVIPDPVKLNSIVLENLMPQHG